MVLMLPRQIGVIQEGIWKIIIVVLVLPLKHLNLAVDVQIFIGNVEIGVHDPAMTDIAGRLRDSDVSFRG